MLKILSSRLQKSLRKMSAKTTLTEDNIKETLREIKIALLEADVNLLVIKKFIASVKKKAIGSHVVGALNPGQQMIDIVREELIAILGKNAKEIQLTKQPSVWMMVGLQGTGKTTSCAKIGWYLRKKKFAKKPLLIAADVYRPAAIDQLVTLGKQISIDTYHELEQTPQTIVKNGLEHAKQEGHDLVIIDTAGRLAIDEKLMRELKDLRQIARPEEIILTIDALSGQDIINVAQTFNDNISLTATLVTKMDSNARGGASLSISNLLNIPIQFIGVGEAIKDIEPFDPKRMAERILGMGDVLSLIEKAKDVIDEKQMRRFSHRMVSGRFDLNDLLEQLRQMKKMGKFSKLISLIPGAQKISEDRIDKAESKLKLYEIIISSMTNEERKNPKLLRQASRKKRVIDGSGRSNQEYNRLLNDFDMMQSKMKEFSKQMGKGNFDLSNMGNMGL